MDREAQDPNQASRRNFLTGIGAGFTSLAMTGMLSADGYFQGKGPHGDDHRRQDPLAPKKPHHNAKAKSCIFLFMYGGPSQMETFDYKPRMYPLEGKTIRGFKTHGRGGKRDGGRIVSPKWGFKRKGVSLVMGHTHTKVTETHPMLNEDGTSRRIHGINLGCYIHKDMGRQENWSRDTEYTYDRGIWTFENAEHGDAKITFHRAAEDLGV